MKRRKYLSALAGVLSGSAFIGTGAITSVEADRVVSVNIESDRDGFLSIFTGPGAEIDGSDLEIRVDGDEHPLNAGGDGVGTNSVYEFDGSDERGVVTIKNRGTASVKLFSKQDNPDIGVSFFNRNKSSRPVLTKNNPSDRLPPGDSILLGLRVEVEDVDLGSFKEEVTLVAQDTKNL